MTGDEIEALLDKAFTVDAFTREEENEANEMVAARLGLVPTQYTGHVHAFRYDYNRAAWFCRVDDCNEEK